MTTVSVAEAIRRAQATRADARALCSISENERERAETAIGALVETLLRAPSLLGDDDTSFALQLPRTPAAVRLVRHHLRRWLERGGADADAVADITLACSEACANAVEHSEQSSRHAFRIEATRATDAIEICVRDFGRWNSTPRAGTYSRGRGLKMIRRLMDDAQIVRRRDGVELRMRRTR